MTPGAEEAHYEGRIRASFARQGLMRTIGATLGRISPGSVEILLVPELRDLAAARVRPRRGGDGDR